MLWAGLLTSVEAAHHQLKAMRAASRSDKAAPLPELAFNLNSLILGNTLIRVLITVIATLIAANYWLYNGPTVAWLGTVSVMLVFAEYIPRRLANRHPVSTLLLGNGVLRIPMKIVWPLAYVFNVLAKTLLRPFLSRHVQQQEQNFEDDVQKTNRHDIVHEHYPRASVLSGIRALDSITVNDILIPRNEVDGVNLDDPMELIIERLIISRHTRLPVYHNDINQVQGVINTRDISHLLPKGTLTKEQLLAVCYEPYFVPESTPLQLQLLNFHKQQRRLGVVVDEYGEVLGIVTLEDILEEIVGEFESEQRLDNPHVKQQEDGRLEVEGAASIRELNKSLGWHLPSDGPKTVNGLVTEALETIPEAPVCLKIGPYRLEILETEDNRVKRVAMWQNTLVRTFK
ncbi:CBS-like protein domain protein [Pseudomonas savastanoi pv. glycinea]|nr:CBS domain-containing protein [Pseudomonas savastanoi pv. glycinea str. B076]KPB24324.1 CBS-like protein domain protein [Pseudomonas amygdali pv. sesami]KPB34140.1 CBS-like protein domain protein [Pseudomonas savastanoi pv. phaseolicola]KPB61876.1 CBS-like protein domain protein [Pseudomonas amygdali pv. mellea]KPB87952.1 CBS-like protein domain protein [Pseudomonas syringae pv. maculicola]KPB98933.1 CBS-like protein domain protein [Pseudomonas amygdali pv. lachrymans]KPC24949.1 CBS-like p